MSDTSQGRGVSETAGACVGLFNPLPDLLHHYQQALREVLEATAGTTVTDLAAPSIEMGAVAPHHKVQRMLRSISSQRQALDFDGPLVMLWPTFGHLEPLVWFSRKRSQPTFVVVHDPKPIRPQWLMDERLGRVGAAAARRGALGTIAHSEPAAAVLRDLNWPNVTSLPIPVLAHHTGPTRKPRSADDPLSVTVFGQWKPSRDLDLLADMARTLSEHGPATCAIRGSGWPAVAGWEVEDRFLADDELAAGLAQTDVVVIPYKEFFQSDIAVRALEAGAAVVGPNHPFLADLFGDDWGGLVDGLDGSEWAAAALRVGPGAGGDDLERRHREYVQGARDAWAHWLSAGVRVR